METVKHWGNFSSGRDNDLDPVGESPEQKARKDKNPQEAFFKLGNSSESQGHYELAMHYYGIAAYEYNPPGTKAAYSLAQILFKHDRGLFNHAENDEKILKASNVVLKHGTREQKLELANWYMTRATFVTDQDEILFAQSLIKSAGSGDNPYPALEKLYNHIYPEVLENKLSQLYLEGARKAVDPGAALFKLGEAKEKDGKIEEAMRHFGEAAFKHNHPGSASCYLKILCKGELQTAKQQTQQLRVRELISRASDVVVNFGTVEQRLQLGEWLSAWNDRFNASVAANLAGDLVLPANYPKLQEVMSRKNLLVIYKKVLSDIKNTSGYGEVSNESLLEFHFNQIQADKLIADTDKLIDAIFKHRTIRLSGGDSELWDELGKHLKAQFKQSGLPKNVAEFKQKLSEAMQSLVGHTIEEGRKVDEWAEPANFPEFDSKKHLKPGTVQTRVIEESWGPSRQSLGWGDFNMNVWYAECFPLLYKKFSEANLAINGK